MCILQQPCLKGLKPDVFWIVGDGRAEAPPYSPDLPARAYRTDPLPEVCVRGTRREHKGAIAVESRGSWGKTGYEMIARRTPSADLSQLEALAIE